MCLSYVTIKESIIMKIAEKIKNLDGWNGQASLYKLSEEVNWEDGNKTSYVIASSVNAMFSGPETLIFPATEDGTCLSYHEIAGYRGGYDHGVAFDMLGYDTV